jgi:hypothetical protein
MGSGVGSMASTAAPDMAKTAGSSPPHRQLIFPYQAGLYQYSRACTYICAYYVMLHTSANIRSDLPPSTMQGGVPERKHSAPDTGNDKFEEMVRKSKLIPFLFPSLNAQRCALPLRGGLSSSAS